MVVGVSRRHVQSLHSSPGLEALAVHTVQTAERHTQCGVGDGRESRRATPRLVEMAIVFFNVRYASTIKVNISSSTSKTAMRQYLPRSVSLEILRNFVCKLLIPWSVFST